MTLNKFLKYYISFIFFSVTIGILVGSLPNHDIVTISPPKLGWNFTWEVLKNNSNNFLSYVFLFFLSPILQFVDLVSIVIQLTLGIRNVGCLATIQKLLPHGLLEIPNFLFYQGLSQYLLLNFWVEKSLNSFLDREKKYVGYYLLSYSILVIASVIEGLIG
ncbi:stage II sporulation protein M [Streptococcus sp.]|jgi:uncharacterized membrane protein SpoIIM required for sporulation|uniref:stage II sporulation protein M n=1 Tax=Streptococcus sp. TaxID=1306 RepID=UPI0017CA4972|nr:stage II sporulation protein M [Streptococcus sp.]HHU65142.1 hypothetical protein [Streptococcus sp.]